MCGGRLTHVQKAASFFLVSVFFFSVFSKRREGGWEKVAIFVMLHEAAEHRDGFILGGCTALKISRVRDAVFTKVRILVLFCCVDFLSWERSNDAARCKYFVHTCVIL